MMDLWGSPVLLKIKEHRNFLYFFSEDYFFSPLRNILWNGDSAVFFL